MPYVIIVYDIAQKRLMKVHKFLKEYLYWSQNSVFEGETTITNLEVIKQKISAMIDPKQDSIILYSIPTPKNMKKTIIGKEKKPVSLTL